MELIYKVLAFLTDIYITINKEASSRHYKKKREFDISRKFCSDAKRLFDEDYTILSETGHHNKRQLVAYISEALQH